MRIRDWSSDVCSSDLNLSIPADPDELRQATSIILVALVHANGQGRVGVTRIDADHGQTGALEFMPEPTRHGARLEADAFGIGSLLGDDGRQYARIGFHPALVYGQIGRAHV